MNPNQFYIRKITEKNIEKLIKDVGFDENYAGLAIPKYKFILLKIHNVTCPQANIIKQLALSVGTDAAVHRDVITCKVDKTDVLLGGSYSQLTNLANKLQHQPFSLKKLSSLILDQIQNETPEPLQIRDKIFDWSEKTYIMGILNITSDSFSDGGKYLSLDKALDQVNNMLKYNVDIIDIGAESTKPFSKEIPPEIQLERIIPILKKIREINSSVPISIDTRHSLVAREAVKNGADIINDVSGLEWDPDMTSTIADLDVPVVIMHSLSDPEVMQINPVYQENIIDVISKNLYDKTEKAIQAGIDRKNIIIDPGIGFGKTVEHNLEIIRRIGEFKSLGYPLLVGISRKSVLSKILNCSPLETEEANIAVNSYLAYNGSNIIRVHDVKKHFKAFKVLDKIVY